MELTKQHIEFIQQDIHQKGIAMDDLAESLVDHICCSIENDTEGNFSLAYAKALKAFGEDGLQKIQDETFFLLILKREITMQKSMYIMGYMAAILATTGLLFKMMHWPGANIMLVSGIALLNLGFLPMYFYDRYKRAIS
ncbi:GldL-related protein [Owenweeksia hongkongensis]|uniref:GldL-related protein n=1 Tax=Owenweeksia hongkongensis TaxID=253245 RepID=UPI003A8EA83E